MYLLSTRTLAHLISDEPRVKRWSDTVRSNQVGASVISIALVRKAVEETRVAEGRLSVDQRLRWVEAQMRQTGTDYLFGEREALIWSRLLSMELIVNGMAGHAPLADAARMVVATAIERSLILVEASQPYHALLQDLKTEDPYR